MTSCRKKSERFVNRQMSLMNGFDECEISPKTGFHSSNKAN